MTGQDEPEGMPGVLCSGRTCLATEIYRYLAGDHRPRVPRLDPDQPYVLTENTGGNEPLDAGIGVIRCGCRFPGRGA